MWTVVRIGSNEVTGPSTDRSTLLAAGTRLVDVARADDRLMLSVDVYDHVGTHLGLLHRNNWRGGPNGVTVGHCTAERVTVIDAATHAAIVDVRLEHTVLVVSALRLCTRDGTRVVVDDDGTVSVIRGSTRPQASGRRRHVVYGSLDTIDLVGGLLCA